MMKQSKVTTLREEVASLKIDNKHHVNIILENENYFQSQKREYLDQIDALTIERNKLSDTLRMLSEHTRMLQNLLGQLGC